MHTIVGAGGASGSLDASNMFKPALARGELQCIGATTLDEYRQYVEKDGALDRRFQKILINAPSINESIEILLGLKEKYEEHIKDIGFSGHHLGIAVDIASYALGANWIERHFTLDRTFKGTDHIASLEPTGLRKLCRDLHATKQSLKYKDSDILHCEISQRKKLKSI